MNRLLKWGLIPLSFALQLQAIDLDFEAARRRWETQQAVSDHAEALYHQQEGVVGQAQSRYWSALEAQKNAENQLSGAQQELQNIDYQIQSLQGQIPSLQNQVSALRREARDTEEEIQSLKRRIRDLSDEVSERERDLRTAQNALAQEQAKPTPDAATIQEIQGKISHIQNQLSHLHSDCTRLENQKRDKERDLERIQNSIQSSLYEIDQKNYALSNAQKQREYALSNISQAQTALSNAQWEVNRATNDLNQQKSVLANYESNWNREYAYAKELYDYYQKVVAAYEREKQLVLAAATKAATTHGSREGEDRAPGNGQIAGTQSGDKLGAQHGIADGESRDSARGYKSGMQAASTNPSLSNHYQLGKISGQAKADTKAQKEDFPKGYNSALKTYLAQVLTTNATVDISESTPEDPGVQSPELSHQPQAIGNQPAPSFQPPSEPPYQVPSAQNPSPSIPAQDNRYYAPPCTGLILSEFEPLCESRYDEVYTQAYQKAYQQTYSQSYKAAFAIAAKESYDAALSKPYPASFSKGEQQGAQDQGVLDGFAQRIPAAKAEQTSAGEREFQTAVEKSHLIVLRGADIVEASGDGLYTPGEVVRVRLVIDNYGGKAIPHGKLRVKITETNGYIQFPSEPRILPALDAQTRSSVTGILKGKIAPNYAGEKIQLKGLVEQRQQDGSFVTIAQIQDEKITHFPVELEAVSLPKKPKVGESVVAKFRFHNLTEARTSSGKLNLVTNPQVIDIAKDLTLPVLEAGEITEVAAPIKPTIWVGENTAVDFLSEAVGIIQPDQSLLQPYKQNIAIDRSASLIIYGANGQPLTVPEITVKAGTTFGFTIRVKYQAAGALPGPFVVRKLETSSPLITSGDGSTVSIDYGSLSPNMQLPPVTFRYQVPSSLKGQTHWVSVGMSEGAKYIHGIKLSLKVQ